jgi:hypothetical protein
MYSTAIQQAAMSQSKAAIVEAFSRFCVLHETHPQPLWVCDRMLQRALFILVDDSLRASPEAWARYFLLSAQPDHPELYVDLPECRLQPVIDAISDRAAQIGREIRVIYAQMIARQLESEVVNFLRSPNPQSERFLTAYLQTACWYAARHFYYNKIQGSSLRYGYGLEDCFQIANEQASQPLKLLQSFQIEQENATIKTYAEKALKGVLQETVECGLLKNESNWKILRYLSKRELVKALELNQNLQVSHYLLVWYCFKEIYQTKQTRQNRLAPPTDEQIQQICDRYNHRCSEFNLFPLTVEVILPDLEAIAQMIRAYRAPNAVLSRIQLDTVTGDPLSELMASEELRQMRAIAHQTFLELPELVQKTLRLWFGLEFNHTEILKLLGTQLGIQKQYQLSRRIKQYRILLLKAVTEKLNLEMLDKLRKGKEAEALINQLLEKVDAYLSEICKAYFYRPLDQVLEKFQPNEKILLQAYYRQRLDLLEIKQQFSITSDAILPIVEILIQFLRSHLSQWIQEMLDLDLTSCESISPKLNHWIETWLCTDATFAI